MKKLVLPAASLGLAFTGVLAGPVEAAPVLDEPSTTTTSTADCKWRVKKAPYKRGGTVRKKVVLRGCGPAKYELQRKRAWGYQTIAETSRVAPPYTKVLKASCRGEGTYTYRVHSIVYFAGDVINRYNSNSRRFTC